jgi:hypothetical protein
VARNGAGGEAVQFVVQIRLDVFLPLPHAGQVELFLSRSAENTLNLSGSVKKQELTNFLRHLARWLYLQDIVRCRWTNGA